MPLFCDCLRKDRRGSNLVSWHLLLLLLLLLLFLHEEAVTLEVDVEGSGGGRRGGGRGCLRPQAHGQRDVAQVDQGLHHHEVHAGRRSLEANARVSPTHKCYSPARMRNLHMKVIKALQV